MQSRGGLELAKDSGFPPAAISARLDLLYADLMDGDVGAAERTIPDLVGRSRSAKGFHQFLWSIRLTVARAEAARLAGRTTMPISFARTRRSRRPVASAVGSTTASSGSRSPARSSRPAGPRRPSRSLRRAIVEAERLGHLPVALARVVGPGRTRGPRSATTRAPRTHASRPSGTSRSSPSGWGTSIGRALRERPDVAALMS